MQINVFLKFIMVTMFQELYSYYQKRETLCCEFFFILIHILFYTWTTLILLDIFM